MSIGQQDIGFDPKDPIIKGKTNSFVVTIPSLQVAEVSSAEWVLLDLSPVETATPSAEVTKTTGAGEITLADVGSDLQATITIDPADTSTLAGTDFYFHLDYIAVAGGEHESVRGRIRLTPRA